MMQLLGDAIVTTSDSADLFVGYWLALGLFAAAAAVQPPREISTRRHIGESVWLPVGLALAVLLPPLGLVAALLSWLATGAVRASWREMCGRRAV